jgi:hypothetical protein
MPEKFSCRRCKANEAERTRRHGWERLLLGVRVFRCLRCDRRFLWFLR